MADDTADFTARQHEHSEQIKLEQRLIRQTGKSLSQIRQNLADDRAETRLAQYADAVQRGNQPREAQRPPPSAIQIQTVQLPARQIVETTTVAGPDPVPPGTGGTGTGTIVSVNLCIDGVSTPSNIMVYP